VGHKLPTCSFRETKKSTNVAHIGTEGNEFTDDAAKAAVEVWVGLRLNQKGLVDRDKVARTTK
jgi:hypothetical protein